jgi:hypothetical protein
VAGAGVAAVVAAGCGGPRQDADEASGEYPVQVLKASFPSAQRLSENVEMRIRVRNVGSKTIPAIAVSLLDPKSKTASQAFSNTSSDAQLASSSRPIWILNQGPKGGDTAFSNTWTLGTLGPRKTKTFTWAVSPARSGDYRILYRVAAGLDGKAKAVTPGSKKPVTGEFDIHVTQKPRQASVTPSGKVVITGG